MVACCLGNLGCLGNFGNLEALVFAVEEFPPDGGSVVKNIAKLNRFCAKEENLQ